MKDNTPLLVDFDADWRAGIEMEWAWFSVETCMKLAAIMERQRDQLSPITPKETSDERS